MQINIWHSPLFLVAAAIYPEPLDDVLSMSPQPRRRRRDVGRRRDGVVSPVSSNAPRDDVSPEDSGHWSLLGRRTEVPWHEVCQM